MWADTLQAFESRLTLLSTAWGGGSVLISARAVLVLSVARIKAPLLYHFAIQCVLWGAAELAWGAFATRDIPLRDFEGAAELARELWLAIGLEAGGVLFGLTLAIGGWSRVKRLGIVGSGIGIVVQASVLLILDLILVRAIRL